ncbi:MAG: PIN domain-containing protein [Treponema sp.]|jgi:predicted nucleic acid-binding protein|nr:PIN domain-containing protein [Treponema sp.]
MLETILIDAGPLIALFDRDDHYHRRIVEFIKDRPYQFVTTQAVLTEVSHMLDFNVNARIAFFEWVMSKGVVIEEIGQDDIPQIVALIKQYRNVSMDFADATLMTVAQKKRLNSIISFDSNFSVYRLPGNVILETVPKPNPIS